MLRSVNSRPLSHNSASTSTITMTDHIYRNFADHEESIRALLRTDATFGEVCADYEEICTWLAAQRRTAGPTDEEYDYAREVVRELEDEIFKMIEENQ